MARENQGYLIGIIILSLLTVILAICTFLGFSANSENRQQRTVAESDKRQLQGRVDAQSAYINVMKRFIGVEGSAAEIPDLINSVKSRDATIGADLDKTQVAFDTAMRKFLSTEQNKDLNLINLVSDIELNLSDSHKSITAANDRVSKLLDEQKAKDTAHEETVKAKDTTIGELQSKLDAEQKRNQEAEQRLLAEFERAKTAHTQAMARLDDSQKALQEKVNDFNNLKTETDKTIFSLREEIRRLTKINNDVADGRITDVSRQTDLVYIDLGSADGLKARQRFAVYDRTETIFEKYLGKAFIEVTEIQGPHRAAARLIPQPAPEDIIDLINLDERNGLITSEQASNLRVQVLNKRRQPNPVLSFDYILSDVWDPGYAVSVALAGHIDVDGDGISDLPVVQSRIEQNGGRIVAMHDLEGNITGQVEPNTRFIVVGDEPRGEAAMKAYTQIIEDAKKNQVQQLSLRELFFALGFQSEGKIERVDTGGTFVPRAPPARPSTSSAYDGDR